MAKKGMHRADNIYDKNKTEQRLYPNCRAELNLATKKANPIIAGTKPPSQKVYHSNRTAKDLFQIFILI